MLHGKRTRRVVAATLLVVMLSNILAPAVSYALTSGPTAPEATSFEPVDTTDMVNLQTGDFTYNIPLMEVPGPEGGYPLSLSYHAGIQTNEDASWVGLGWTLNPGAITRSVNGYPDDWQSQTNSSHVYWEGGETSSYKVGVSVGIANTPGSVNFGLSFSQDTYRGFGVGVSVGIGGQLAGTPLSIGLSMGVGPYDAGYAGLSLGISGGKGLAVSLGLNVATNFESLSAGAAASVGFAYGQQGEGKKSMSGSLLGASINTNSDKVTVEAGGITSDVSSSKDAGVQTSTSGFSIDIPVWYGINVSLGYSKTRYWTDERTDVYTHGSLNSSGYAEVQGNPYHHAVLENHAYDTYSLLEDPAEKNVVDHPDPQKVQGGAFLDFDVYSVNAQGLAGNMRPYLFQGEALGQNKRDEEGVAKVIYYSPGVTHGQPKFRFIGDFSNSYRQAYPTYPDPSLNLRAVEDIPFDPNPVYGNNDGNYGYSYSNGLAGSRHIDVGVKIQPYNILGYNKADRYVSGMIDGFSITNESGVTYHYGLPAYAYGEELYQERISRDNGFYFNRGTKPNAYAYTWYLTTITGPDFVDRNGDSKADPGDWGYWINFEYGKWSNDYIWRNPSEGYHRDEDNEWQTCSMGKKEVYYLNTIRTRTHVALFAKDGRVDGHGLPQQIFAKNSEGGYVHSSVWSDLAAGSLSLKKIFLLNASDYSSVAFNNYSSNPNVFEIFDVPIVNSQYTLDEKAIRVIDFEYDTYMSPNTANSFYASGPLGKMTLGSIKMRGRQGASLLPPVKFDYDLTGDEVKTATGTLSPTSFVSTSDNFEIGELVQLNDSWPYSRTYCGVIINKTLSGGNYTYTLKNGLYTGGAISATLRNTKNPAYNKDAFDSWGSFKSDYDVSLIAYNENVGRRTTPISARSVDAWSLRKITSALGAEIKIKYESDRYRSSVLNRTSSLIMKNIVPQSNKKTMTFQLETAGQAIQDFITIGQSYKVLLLAPYYVTGENQFGPPNEWQSQGLGIWRATLDHNSLGLLVINSISGNTVTGTLTGVIPESTGGFVDLSEFQLWTHFYTDYQDQVFTGNLIMQATEDNYGGGIRVASVSVFSDVDPVEQRINYNYNFNSVSSGVTSYLPHVFDPMDRQAAISTAAGANVNGHDNDHKAYKAALLKDINALLPIAREVVPPGVYYEYVTISQDVKNMNEALARSVEGATQYQFEIFRENMIGRINVTPKTDTTTAWGHFTTRNIALKKFTGSIGKLKRVTKLDKDGKKLAETINHFLHDGLEALPLADFMSQYKDRLAQFNYQGYLQERVSEVKVVDEVGWNPASQVMATLSAREDYPCIATGQTVINYLNGTRTSSQTLGFDFYSGAVVKSVDVDVYGNRFMTETVPAYRKYEAMGLKLNNNNNKNMLSQTAATYLYKVDANNNKLGLASADITVWSNQVPAIDPTNTIQIQGNPFAAAGDVWRTHSLYNWLPDNKTTDGLTAIGNFVDFNWTTPASADAGWKKGSELTLYDVYSKGLEAKDINNNFAATQMGYNRSKVLVSGSPAKYYEMAFSGAEETNTLVGTGEGIRISEMHAFYHTGSYSLSVSAGTNKKGFTYSVSTDKLTAGRDYQVSVWVKANDGWGTGVTDVKLYYDINGVVKAGSISSGSSTKVADNWRLITLKINGSDITGSPSDILNVYCRNEHATVYAYVDDFKFQPGNAVTTAYVYDAFSGELSHVLDKNNMFIKYEYDAHGRLRKIIKESFQATAGNRVVEEYDYNYVLGTRFDCDGFTWEYIKQCPPGQNGTSVLVNVNPGQFKSNISKADANAKAQAYAQNYANQNGTCVAPGVYARLEYVSADYGETSGPTESYMAHYVDIYVRFYSDPQCTNPITLTSGITINVNTYGCMDYIDDVDCYSGSQGFGIPSGVQEYMIYGYTSLYGQWLVFDENMEIIYMERWGDHYDLQPGAGLNGVGAALMNIGTPPWW